LMRPHPRPLSRARPPVAGRGEIRFRPRANSSPLSVARRGGRRRHLADADVGGEVGSKPPLTSSPRANRFRAGTWLVDAGIVERIVAVEQIDVGARETYIRELFAQEDDLLREAREEAIEQGLPAIHVQPEEG